MKHTTTTPEIETPTTSSYELSKEDFKLRMSRRRIVDTVGETHKNIKVLSVVTEKKDGSPIMDRFNNKIAIVSFNAMTPWHADAAMEIATNEQDYTAAENRGRLTANVILGGTKFLPEKGQHVNITLTERDSDGAIFVQDILPMPQAAAKFRSFDDL